MRRSIRTLAAAVVLALSPLAQAQVTTVPSDRNAGQNLVATKIAGNFTDLAGSEDNALALVNALRAGGEVTLVTTVPPPAGSPPGTLPTTTETSFAVPTKPMGWGNVKHALALAQDQLQRAGITDPTAEQLQIALTGGDLVRVNADGTTTTTTVKGILTMRADGMGWGNIAREGGTKLGQVQKVDMSAKSVKASAATTTGVTTAAAAPSATTVKSKGITTAAGGTAGSTSVEKGPAKGMTTASGATASHGAKGLVTASGASAGANPPGNAYGRGIVTAGGGGSGNVAAIGHGKSNAAGAGVVTGGGSAAAASGVTSGAGNSGKGTAGGNGNGKGKGG